MSDDSTIIVIGFTIRDAQSHARTIQRKPGQRIRIASVSGVVAGSLRGYRGDVEFTPHAYDHQDIVEAEMEVEHVNRAREAKRGE